MGYTKIMYAKFLYSNVFFNQPLLLDPRQFGMKNRIRQCAFNQFRGPSCIINFPDGLHPVNFEGSYVVVLL